MKKEIWKKVKGFDNYYVSNNGKVLSNLSNKILKNTINGSGYYFVNLYKDKKKYNKMIHKLVFENFNNKISNRTFVIDHIDNNKLNNNLSNLQLITNRENSTKDKKQISNNYCIYITKNNNYMVRLRINGLKKSLGTYKNINEAIIVRNNFFIKETKELIKNQ
jgi:hypothetical protein